jgi:phytoene desaturase
VSRVVVVGAGMGGLAVAARLAAQGHQVTVCEQAAAVGGKLGRHERDGFRFDTGPSLITLPDVYRDLFGSTGGPLEEVLDLVPVQPLTRYRFPDGSWLDLPNAGPEAAAAVLQARLGGRAGVDWGRLMAHAGEVWDLVRGSVLEAPLGGLGDLLRLAGRPRDLRLVAPWQTLRGLGRGYLADPRLRLLLERYATYTGSDPRRAPAALVTVPYVESRYGGWSVRGGLYRLAEAVSERARELGVRIRFRAEVVAVELSGQRVAGVRLADGERLTADVVVSDADAAHLYGDLLPASRASHRLRRSTPSLSGFVLLLGLCGRTPGLAHHTVLFGPDYDREFDDIFGPRPRPLDDPTVYLSVPDDPEVCPPGREGWFVLVNAPRHAPRGGVDWTAPGLADRYADHVLDVVARRGLDVRDRLLFRDIRTPADLERATRSPGGSIYGTSSNGIRAAFLRPANRSHVPGLFLVGGSAHPGGGLPLVGLSAATVARMIGPA